MSAKKAKDQSVKAQKTVDFGFKEVSPMQKTHLVQNVFSQVATKYDIMNDLMSMGLHHSWKKKVIIEICPQANDFLLDLAGGTGDVATMFLNAGGGNVVVCDLNQEMLDIGKTKAAGKQYAKQMQWVHADAEKLPFPDDNFDYCTISFGIRNFTNKHTALCEIKRVLKPGGKLICLEFSHVNNAAIATVYNWYAFKIIPQLGKLIADNQEAYQYLAESIKKFPKAPQFLAMLEDAGFSNVSFNKFTFGIVAMHIAYNL